MGGKKRTRDATVGQENYGKVSVVLDDKSDPPFCDHGPTILFQRESSDATKCFYACSAFRDRKGCPFFVWKNAKLSQSKKQEWKSRQNVKTLPTLDDVTGRNGAIDEFYFCRSCSKLLVGDVEPKHKGHTVTKKLSKSDLSSPTKILTVQNASKKEAQFYFSANSTKLIIENLLKNGLTRVLCIGTPKIHEAIGQLHAGKMHSLLLDFDSRLSQFFGSGEFCHYNMFNHHFFAGKKAYLDFLRASNPGNLVVVTDPPFGGRCELITNTFSKIKRDFSDLKKIPAEAASVQFMWIFPYFMEHQMKQYMPEIEMSDYQVSYQTDSGYRDGKEGGKRKQGSPVRIFTTIQLSKLDLSLEPGYKFCSDCDKWVAALNKHCAKCRACTAKNGGEYRHCDECGKCVKESWSHCDSCNRCGLTDHRCQGERSVGSNGSATKATPSAADPSKDMSNKTSKKNFQKNRNKKQKMN